MTMCRVAKRTSQSKAGVMNNKMELYVPYSDIGKTGVADNNKILAIHHPVDTNKSKSEFVVSHNIISNKLL